jgi:phage shock protein PspC (stress-responsive transcriptional regulator)
MNTSTADSHDSSEPDEARDDSATGGPVRPPLRRPVSGRVLAGVAAAIARHFSIDVTIVRVAFAVLTVIGFTGLAWFGAFPLYLCGIPLYLACWVLIPEEGDDHSIAGRLLASLQHRHG